MESLSDRAFALSNLRLCLLLALSSRIGWIVSIYNRGAKLAIFYGILCFFRSEMRGDVSLVLCFSILENKKGASLRMAPWVVRMIITYLVMTTFFLPCMYIPGFVVASTCLPCRS